MFGKKKPVPQIDKDQLEFIQNAQKRIKQKKRLYIHFVVFLIGAVFLIIANTVLGVAEEVTFFGKEWFVFAILIWLFLFVYHVISVFIIHKFMGKEWEEEQLGKLVDIQKERIELLKQKVEKDIPIAPKVEISKKDSEKKKSELTLIAAAGENNAIGKDNKLLWHLSDDLKRFKYLTNGHYIIMGRKTFESFITPLPNRIHVIITRERDYKVPDGVIVVNSLEDALDASRNDIQPFIIGGGEIYKQAMTFADKIELTRVHDTFEADTFFPEVDTSIWKETNNIFHSKDQNNEYDFSFITYQRK